MKKITIHQPNFLPWMGFFEKARLVDVFVFLDHVPYSKGSYSNRVRYFCKSSQEIKWLTIPVKSSPLGTPINEIELSASQEWVPKIIHTIEQNIDTPLTEAIIDRIVNRRTTKLVDLNISLIKLLMKHLDLSPDFIKSSQMQLEDSADQEVLKIAKSVNATHYVSGMGASKYLNRVAFAQNGIQVQLMDFKQELNKRDLMKDTEVSLSALYALKV